MLYALVHPIAKLGFKIFFRHIHMHGLENIPTKGPLIIAANHPTAFIEPCLAACFQKRTLNFIVRGDIFKNPFYIKMLKSLHLIPIFRFKDGYANLKNNQETFKYCNEVLKEEKTIFILAEGRTIQEKKLRPIQKGPARMAFGAYDAYGIEDTVIIPLGFTYEMANVWRKDVMIQCGAPIYLKDYIKEYKENPNQAIQSLTDSLGTKLKETIVNIDQISEEPICDLLFDVIENERKKSVFPILIKNNKSLIAEQLIANRFNQLAQQKKELLTQSILKYKNLLEKYRILDSNVKCGHSFSLIKVILSVLCLVFCLPGVIFYFLPVISAKTIASKKVYVKEFQAPVLFALVTFFVLVWTIIAVFSGIAIFGWYFLIPIIIVFILGFFSIIFFESLQMNLSQLRFDRLNSTVKDNLLSNRSFILEWINEKQQD